MSRYRDFDAARAETEPLAFRLGGQDFTTVAPIPSGPVLDVANAQRADGETQYEAFVNFFREVIPEEQYVTFADAARTVGFDDLRALLEWIIEEATARPLPSVSPSPAASARATSLSKLRASGQGVEARSA